MAIKTFTVGRPGSGSHVGMLLLATWLASGWGCSSEDRESAGVGVQDAAAGGARNDGGRAQAAGAGASGAGGAVTGGSAGAPPLDSGAGDARPESADAGDKDAGVLFNDLRPVRLRTELQLDPLAVQVVNPRLTWELESAGDKRGEAQSAYEVRVSSSLQKAMSNDGDLQSTGFVTGADSQMVYSGRTLEPRAQAFWRVRVRDSNGGLSPWSAPASWTTALPAEAWAAPWITAGDGASLPILRREFAVPKPVQRALISVCGLGHFELRVNGVNASDAVMEPGWTDYRKVCQYVTYDVTNLLVPGANALGVLLGNGMYNVPQDGRYAKFRGSFGPLKLMARLDLAYLDGTQSAVISDASWKVSSGPITFSNTYGGEDFDARKEPSGWDKPGFDASSWTAAKVASGPAPALVARSAPALKVMQKFAPIKVTEPTPAVFVYDLGQNAAGWPALTVEGAAGATVKLTPGELLNANGTVSQVSSGSPVSFSYTLKGGAPEAWHPRFSYYGFRYVQVEGAVPVDRAAGARAKPVISALEGQFVYAAAEQVGHFASADADLNAIHALVLSSIRSNLQSVLTDCPHREKLGWLETSHLLARSIAYNYDVQAFYEKIVGDMRDAQTGDGLIPDIAPELTVFSGAFRDSPEWGSAFVINPWTVYQMYGDRRAIEEHYANMKRYAAYLQNKATQSIVAYGLGDWYDVGPAAPGVSQLTSQGVTGTAVLLQDLDVLKQSALLLGKASDVSAFAAQIDNTTKAFNARFLSAAGSYDRGSQTANGMPLALGLVPAAQEPAVLGHLVAAVSNAKYQVTAGDVGFVYVLRALTDAGRSDVIYQMAKQTTGPGYRYQLMHGATSLTEAWDANPSSSQNHAMLGHIDEWFYRGLGGINPDPQAAGFARAIIKPQWVSGVAWASADYHSRRGVIATRWDRAGSAITLKVTVPVNTQATIYLPTNTPSAVTEGGTVASHAAGVTSSRELPGALVLEVGSGVYTFAVP